VRAPRTFVTPVGFRTSGLKLRDPQGSTEPRSVDRSPQWPREEPRRCRQGS
jgi:hypothetical protein